MNDKWTRDTGLVFALFFLVLGVLKETTPFLWVSGLFLMLVLFAPNTLKPLAWAWLKIAEWLGFVMNKVFFGVVFFVVVVPVGLIRRMLGTDQRDERKQPEEESAFINRDHTVEAGDLIKPY